MSTPDEQAENARNFEQDLADPDFIPQIEKAIRDAGFPVAGDEENPT